MSSAKYEKLLQDVPNKYALLRLLGLPLYEIELSNNQLIAVCHYKDGSHKRHQLNADFSNSRMVIADFHRSVEAISELLAKFPRHFLGISGVVIANVTEELTDGITPIEIKAIKEALWVASSKARRRMVQITVNYQNEKVSTESLN